MFVCALSQRSNVAVVTGDWSVADLHAHCTRPARLTSFFFFSLLLHPWLRCCLFLFILRTHRLAIGLLPGAPTYPPHLHCFMSPSDRFPSHPQARPSFKRAISSTQSNSGQIVNLSELGLLPAKNRPVHPRSECAHCPSVSRYTIRCERHACLCPGAEPVWRGVCCGGCAALRCVALRCINVPSTVHTKLTSSFPHKQINHLSKRKHVDLHSNPPPLIKPSLAARSLTVQPPTFPPIRLPVVRIRLFSNHRSRRSPRADPPS